MNGTTSTLPAPIYPDLKSILAEHETKHQAFMAGLDNMATLYDQVCRVCRNYEITQDHSVKLYPTGIIVTITLSHDDRIADFHQLWKELYWLLKPERSEEDLPKLTMYGWDTNFNVTCREHDAPHRYIDFNLRIPTEGCRDVEITKRQETSIVTRYEARTITRERNWYKDTGTATDLVPY